MKKCIFAGSSFFFEPGNLIYTTRIEVFSVFYLFYKFIFFLP